MDCKQVTLLNKTGSYEGLLSIEKSKSYPITFYLVFKSNAHNFSLCLRNLYSSQIRQISGPPKIQIYSPTDAFHVQFSKMSDAKEIHEFIASKSEVHKSNDLLDGLDVSIEALWPFPGGIFM